jgi:hypothetical protein
MKRRLALVLLPVLLLLAVLQVVPAHASSRPPTKVNVSAPYAACAGNYWLGLGICIPWTL